MVQVRDLTELTLRDRWHEVKGEDEWWEDLSPEVLRMVKRLLENAMEEELLEQLRAGRHRRTEMRRGYRNGYRYRSLQTRLGVVENLRVPRDREGCYQPTVFQRYQQRQQQVDELIREAFLGGVSTRRIGQVLAPVLGQAPSAQTVSRILRDLDGEVGQFHRQHLGDSYCYLLLDGIVLKVKGAARATRRLVLCAYAITPEGRRRLLSFRQAPAESEAQWEAFLRDLYDRGLQGKGLVLVVTDGNPGLHKALDTVYPYVPRQRCWVHKLRNVASKLPRKDQAACLKGAKAIYMAPTRREAVARFWAWADKWRASQPKAVVCIEDDLDDLLNFLACPPDHWAKVRTTNAIERAFREVRRRTRPMSCFNNAASVDRIIYGIISHLNHAWQDKPLAQFTHNT